MLTRRYFIRVIGDHRGRSWSGPVVACSRRGSRRREDEDPDLHFPARRGRRPEHRRSVFREALLRPPADALLCPLPGKQNGAIDLDGRFGLHPQLQQLKPLWDSGQLAIVHAAGSPEGNRSHFEAQDQMESGTPGRTMEDGWLNRALPACHAFHLSDSCRCDGSEDAAHSSRQPRRNSRQRSSAVSGAQSGRRVDSREHVRVHAGRADECARQRNFRCDQDDRIDQSNALHAGQWRSVPGRVWKCAARRSPGSSRPMRVSKRPLLKSAGGIITATKTVNYRGFSSSSAIRWLRLLATWAIGWRTSLL